MRRRRCTRCSMPAAPGGSPSRMSSAPSWRVPGGRDHAGKRPRSSMLPLTSDMAVPRKPTREEAVADVARIERAWNVLGVHKWLAYEVSSGEAVGRGGLSCMVLGSDVACEVLELLRPAPWLDEAFNPGNGMQLARRWFE